MNRKIKILFIHSQLVCGGAEQALFDLISLMDKTKFDITVIVQIDGGIWEQKFRDAGIKVMSIWSCQKNSKYPIAKLKNLLKRKQIVKAIANDGEGLLDICFDQKFDVIVSYHVWSMPKMGFSRQAKTVKYIHGDAATHPPLAKNILAQLNELKRFDRIICVSDIARRSFEAVSGITKNVSAHFNPLNSKNVQALAKQEIFLPGDGPIICAVGRLSEEKGFERLIRIHKRLLEEGLYHRLVIVGDGPEKEHLNEVVREVHGEESVILAGYRSNPYPYMRQSAFVVCSSYTEGLSVIAMEAISLGIPIVSSVPSVGEIFGGNFCGLITENDDISLENGIRRMLADPLLYAQAKVGAESRSRFFDGKRMVREVEDEFMALVADNK